MFDIQEYANAKGIPVESIPADVFDKAQGKSYAIREAKDPMADTFKEICTKSQELLAACTSESGVSIAKYGVSALLMMMQFMIVIVVYASVERHILLLTNYPSSILCPFIDRARMDLVSLPRVPTKQ